MQATDDRRRRAKRWAFLFFGAALAAIAVQISLRFALGGDNWFDTPLSMLALLLGGLSMKNSGWVRGFDAGRRVVEESTDG